MWEDWKSCDTERKKKNQTNNYRSSQGLLTSSHWHRLRQPTHMYHPHAHTISTSTSAVQNQTRSSALCSSSHSQRASTPLCTDGFIRISTYTRIQVCRCSTFTFTRWQKLKLEHLYFGKTETPKSCIPIWNDHQWWTRWKRTETHVNLYMFLSTSSQ